MFSVFPLFLLLLRSSVRRVNTKPVGGTLPEKPSFAPAKPY
jgi:hypothetical protein